MPTKHVESARWLRGLRRIGPGRLVLATFAAVLLVGSPASAQPAERPAVVPTTLATAAPAELHVMSFNLRFAGDEPPNSWPERRPVVRELLRDERPDIIGTQEGLFQQLRDIEAGLPRYYESLGLGREGGSHGEAMQVFYDARRLEILEYDHYWLSDTPDVIGSQTWGGCCPRMVTWIRFLDTRTGTEFYLANTHFEAFDADAREMSADLMRERMAADFDPRLPVVATGDFNAPAGAGHTVFDLLVTDGPFLDTWEEAESRGPLYATFHGYRPLVPDGDRIDWILATPGVTTRVASINTYQRDGQFPSDHLPVQAMLRLPPAERSSSVTALPHRPRSV
jgi:endonuclease/exonuclease/phosphatase family metal-dependent hydrolase